MRCRTGSKHERTQWQSILFARNSCGNRCLKALPRSGGRNAAGTPFLQKTIKVHKPRKCMKHTMDSGAFLLCPDSPLRSKQKAKSGAARKRGAFAFAQLRGEGTQIDPHGLRRKPKMPKIINLGNCVKLLWDTTF